MREDGRKGGRWKMEVNERTCPDLLSPSRPLFASSAHCELRTRGDRSAMTRVEIRRGSFSRSIAIPGKLQGKVARFKSRLVRSTAISSTASPRRPFDLLPLEEVPSDSPLLSVVEREELDRTMPKEEGGSAADEDERDESRSSPPRRPVRSEAKKKDSISIRTNSKVTLEVSVKKTHKVEHPEPPESLHSLLSS